MKLRVGTSGYSYKEWKGPFYPEDLAAAGFLAYYATRLNAVEINNTFYRIPKTSVVEHWAEQVPDDFVFVLKASRRVTHFARLKESADEPLSFVWQAAQTLGANGGPILFQLPPTMRKSADRLRAFCGRLPDGLRAVFEFRHASWFDDEVHAILADRGAALCVADGVEGGAPELVSTADFGYLRLRRPDYGAADLDAWAEKVRAQPWREVHVFFKHEDAGAGPRMAEDFAARFAAEEPDAGVS